MYFLNIIKKITSILCDLKKLFKKQDMDENKKIEIINNEFNKRLEKTHNTQFCDSVRKQKQEEIEKLKKLLIFLCIFLCGCSTTKYDVINEYDYNKLKTTDKSYQIACTQKIITYNNYNKEEFYFDNNWYIVHRDFIKTFNENQDYIISNLKKLNKSKNKDIKIIKYCIYSIIFILVIIILYGKSIRKQR